MAFLNDIGKKIGSAANATAVKAKEVAEVTKLNSRINAEEKQIEKLYTEIGKLIFELDKDNPESPAAEQITKILTALNNIDELRQNIEEVRNTK